ncbi:MAG: GNAT family N-acetyltransferase [Gemmatimonadales bacterium]
MTPVVEVILTYLELLAPRPGSEVPSAQPGLRPATLAPSAPPAPVSGELPSDVELRHEQPPRAAAISARMYGAVGAGFHWLDRRHWTDDQWRAAVNRAGVEVWTARIAGEIAGYFELHVEPEGVELKYFGLLGQFIGRGLGRGLLSAALRRARSIGTGRVTVNTCSLDHPAALPNYVARGFRVVRTDTERRTLSA